MIQSKHSFQSIAFHGSLLVVFVFMHTLTRAQLFIDEGMERGVDATVSAFGFSAPGVSAIDFDQDGDDDLTIGSDGNVLFYQNNEGQFELIDLGLETPSGDLQAVIWADINNNGKLDLLLTSYLSDFRLYKNLGDLQFEDITESCGISTDIASNTGASFADIDRDGYLDLQFCRYETEESSSESPSVMPELWTRLYLNNGDETFTDFTSQGGLVIEPVPVFLGVFLDFNNDLWPDNYTIVDRDPGNRLFVNNQGVFSDITEEYNVSYPENDIMSNTVADYNNDGFLDIFMTNDAVSTFLLKNNQGESFTDVASSAGVSVDIFGWGAIWIDADNDGWQDLFFGTPSYVGDYFFLNDQGTFTQEESAMELDEVPSFSAAKGDFDNDGFYDMIIQSKAPDRSPLLMNQGNENGYVKITPHGTVSNRMAVGSWVKVYTNGSEYVHFTLCGEGYISQNSQHLIFGLGEATSAIDSVSVWYPSGHTDSYYNLSADTAYHFYEGETFQVEIIQNDTLVCEGEMVQLDAGDHSGYLWNTGDTTRFISADTAGVYSVSVTNSFGILASDEVEVVFQPLPLISETITPNPCLGDSAATISLENLVNIEADSVIWNNGMAGETIDSLFSGEYSYTYTDVNGCTASGTISIIDPLELLVFADANPADVDESNGSIDVTIFGGVSPYVILFEEDTVASSIPDLPVGEYTITVVDSYGCTVTVEIQVDSSLGVTRNDFSESISIYPNPTQGRVAIESQQKVAHVSIYELDGSQAREVTVEEETINLEDFPVGPYILKIELVNSEVGYFRLIKE